MGRQILFLHDDKDIPKALERELRTKTTWGVVFEPLGKHSKHHSNHRYDLVILESRKGLAEAVQQVPPSISHPVPIIAIPPVLLKKNSGQFVELVQGLLAGRAHTAKGKKGFSADPLIEDFVGRKLKEFVRKIKLSQCRNLYDLLLREIERPLLTLILQETQGNQIQAAQILGMNRNTLRKKIKELKIPLKRK